MDEIKKLLEEIKQNILIAEFCEGKFTKGEDVGEYDRWIFDNEILYRLCYGPNPPDFLNDKNAINEAKKFLSEEQLLDFIRYLLSDVLRVDHLSMFSKMIAVSLATANEEAEAFLRTIEKY
jgi:hypothetical protein